MKGQKTGGRVAGTPNRISFSLRSKIQTFLEDRFDEVVKSWGKLSEKEKIDAYDKMLRYIIPPARDKEADESLNQTVSTLVDRLFKRERQE